MALPRSHLKIAAPYSHKHQSKKKTGGGGAVSGQNLTKRRCNLPSTDIKPPPRRGVSFFTGAINIQTPQDNMFRATSI